MEKPIATIELGSKKAKLVVGYELNGKPHVLYTLVKPYGQQVIEGGKFSDFQLVANALKDLTSVVDPSVKLKLTISDIVLSLPPYGVNVLSTKQTAGTTDEGKVTNYEIKTLYSIIRNCQPNSENILVDILPKLFTLDHGRAFEKAPIGETTSTITVVANTYTVPSHIYNDFTNVVKSAGLNPKRPIISSLATIEMINLDPSLPTHYFLVDLGACSTTVALVGKKCLYNAAYINWGGDCITNKIMNRFGIIEADAEKYKIAYGIDKRKMNFKAPICITEDDMGNAIKHTTDELNEIIFEELDHLTNELKTVMSSLLTQAKISADTQVPIIIVGGTSKLKGLLDYISPKLNSQDIRIYNPKILGARNPTFLNCLGMIMVCGKYPTFLDDNSKRIGPVSRDK